MPGKTDLNDLLAEMKPELHWDTYVFVTTTRDIQHVAIRPKMQFRETEGTTLIMTRGEAEAHSFPYTYPSRMITLSVDSSLEAIGFMAAIASRLAELGISVNPVAAFHHDHIFVPEDRAEEALAALEQLAAG
ncbi:MAG: hypothetical protein CMK07_12465 [Ponticaulis sp.]|nr:hypothetical protein [Ponticaulis sp.]